MYREHTVGVVVPAYDEEGFVGDVITGIPSFVDRVYVVDDCSTDGTWAEILAAADATARAGENRDAVGSGDGDMTAASGDADGDGENTARTALSRRSIGDGYAKSALFARAEVHEPIGRAVPIRHDRNRGAGGAVKTGYLAALEDGSPVDIVATIDADGQMDSRMLPRFLDPIVEGAAEYTKGNRLLDPTTREEMPTFRLFGNSILTLLTKIASGYWKTMDPQNGYTAISTEALAAVDVEGMYEYYGYCTDLLIKLNVERARVTDVGMPARYGEETSSIKYEEYIRKVSLLLLRGFLWRLKTRYLLLGFHPLALLYGLGALVTGTGIVEAVATLRRALSAKESATDSTAGSLTYGALTTAVGCTLLVLSMIFDLEANERLEAQTRE
jgi:glycosyltransferase involved in cell wall biosynthesis